MLLLSGHDQGRVIWYLFRDICQHLLEQVLFKKGTRGTDRKRWSPASASFHPGEKSSLNTHPIQCKIQILHVFLKVFQEGTHTSGQDW